jgi:hypothetical protein
MSARLQLGFVRASKAIGIEQVFVKSSFFP